jgi:hypothetical protein
MAYSKFQRLMKRLVAGKQRSDWLKSRQQLALDIAAKAEDGMVLVVESGRDCDGVQYWGRTSTIPAAVMSFIALETHTAKWADGPFRLDIERPSMEKGIDAGSRDLGMEAFEDGHPHVLYG